MTTMIKIGSSLAGPVKRVSLLALLVAGLAAALPTAAHAQYFGRNKIQYEKFDWYVLSTERFNIHGYTVEDDTLLVVGSGKGLRAVSLRKATSRSLVLHGVTAACGVTDAGRDLVVVARRPPDLTKIRAALTRLPGGARKWALVERAGPMEPLGGVWVQRVGCTSAEAATLLARSRVHGALPEPLRLAHLIAGALGRGYSRGRA